MAFLVTATGNLVDNPELRFSKNGKAVCSFRIACDTGKDKPTVFKDCVSFNTLAENIAASCMKGDKLIVRGRMESQEWVSKDGRNMSKDIIIGEDVGASLFFAELSINRKPKEDYTGENKYQKGNFLTNDDDLDVSNINF